MWRGMACFYCHGSYWIVITKSAIVVFRLLLYGNYLYTQKFLRAPRVPDPKIPHPAKTENSALGKNRKLRTWNYIKINHKKFKK